MSMQNIATISQRKLCSDAICSSGCGANFTSPSGRVVSPNYPADYPYFSNCNYTIRAVQAVLVLTFKTFEVEGTWNTHARMPKVVLTMFLFYL